MSVNTEANVTEEALQFRGSAREAAELAAGLLAQLGHRARLRVAQRALDRPITQRLRIQLRRVRRQPLELVVGPVCGEEGLHRLRPVRGQAIPDDDQRPADAAPKVAQRSNDLLSLDTTV